MADEQIVTSIVAKADLSSLVSEVHRATASLQQLQRELLASNKSIASATKVANNLFRDTLTGSGYYSSHFVNLQSDVDKFGKQLDAGRLKLKDYFQTFRTHATTQKGLIRELAKEQVMLQNSVLQPLGRNAQGLMQYNVMIPRGLDAVKNSAQLARMEMQIMNRALLEGSTSLINWGKNTQWAGRQLTVGLTVPLAMFGSQAAKAFREADQELTRLVKVYGDISGTASADLQKIRQDVTQTAKELSSAMGVSFKETIGLAADIAATGQQGDQLLSSLKETTRLAVLGEVDRQEAMKATLAIQTAFKSNTQQLTESINFLNAVENQTSTTLNDLVEAIPKAGTVVKQLGGDVKDLALYLTAMREGGVSASEAANALKSGLASMINPTKQTIGVMSDFGIDIMGLVQKNTGDTTGMILDLQKALEGLDPLSKARALEQMFGKFQFARMSALFNNLGKSGSQTLQVMDLMKANAEQLAGIASRELTLVTESASGKYRRAIEGLRASLADVGEEFLGVATKFINAFTKVLDFFNNLPGPIKKAVTYLGGFTAVIGPIIMLTGVLANFFGYITKGVVQLRAFFQRASGWKMLTPEIIATEKAAQMVEKSFYGDAAAAEVLHGALTKLISDYMSLQSAMTKGTIPVNPAVTTVSGSPVMSPLRRIVDPNDPYVGEQNTRAMSHINPRDPDNPATFLGGVPGALPVNQKIGRTPQIYMHDRLPNIPGLTTVKGVSTGIVANEAARYHALLSTLAMQTEAEVAALKKTISLGGTVSADLLSTFDDILPLTSSVADNAAQQSAAIVAQLRAGKITAEQARAEIMAINAQMEAQLQADIAAYAASRGRTIDFTKAPLMNQPVVDANGQFTLRDLYKKEANRAVMEEFGRLRGVRTFGAPYSIQTTKLPKFELGGPINSSSTHFGNIETFGPGKTTVSGDTSINYDDRLGRVPVGGYVLNQSASMDSNNSFITDPAVVASTYNKGGKVKAYNPGGEITAALTPGEIVYGPKIQEDPVLYAAVHAANNGYNFGGQIMRSTFSYGNDINMMSAYAKHLNSPNFTDVDAANNVAYNATMLTKLTGMDPEEARIIASQHHAEATEYAMERVKKNPGLDFTTEYTRARNVQLIKLARKYPNLIKAYVGSGNIGESKAVKYDPKIKTAAAANFGGEDFRAAFRSNLEASGLGTVTRPNGAQVDLLERAFLLSGSTTSIDKSHFMRAELQAKLFKAPGHLENLLKSGLGGAPLTAEEAAEFRRITGVVANQYAYQGTAVASSVNRVLSKLPGTKDILSPNAKIQKDVLVKGLSALKGGRGRMSWSQIFMELLNPKSKNSVGRMLSSRYSGLLPTLTGQNMLIAKMVANMGGPVPGGSISRNRKNYGLTLLSPEKMLKVLANVKQLSSKNALGSFAGMPVASYSHQIVPSSGKSYPIPGVSGVYKNDNGELVFFKGVPNEISAKAEMYGTRMSREVFGLDSPVQVPRTISNPYDPSGKSKLLGLESKFDPKFSAGGTKFTEDQMIRQTIASLLMGNKDLSKSNVFGNVLADVGPAGVFPRASMNTAYAESMNSMEKQALINLLAVRGGARKDFAYNTSQIAAGMSPRQYGAKMKSAMKKMHPKLKAFIESLPESDRAPYIAMLGRLEDGMKVNWNKYQKVHAAPAFNGGGMIGGGRIVSGRRSYGRPGNPAAREKWEEQQRQKRAIELEAQRSRAASHQIYGQQGLTTGLGREAVRQGTTSFYNPGAYLRSSMIDPFTNKIAMQAQYMQATIKNAGVVLKQGMNALAVQSLASAKYAAASFKASGVALAGGMKSYVTDAINKSRDIKNKIMNYVPSKSDILREQAAVTARAYPGTMMPVSLFGPGVVGDWKQTGQEGVQSRKVGSLGFRRKEYMVGDKIMSAKQMRSAGMQVPVRAGGANQMALMMGSQVAGMGLMGQGQTQLGTAVMTAGMVASFLPFGRMLNAVKKGATGVSTAIRGIATAGLTASKVIAGILRFAKGFGPLGIAISAVAEALNLWKKANDNRQDSAMRMSMTVKGAEQAGIKYFNLAETMKLVKERQDAIAAGAKGAASTGAGMPGLVMSIKEMKKAKEEGKGLKEMIESINRTKNLEETIQLVSNQKAQFVAAGMSAAEANKKIYGALANSEKASSSFRIFSDQTFGSITDKASAAQFAVNNLLGAIKEGNKSDIGNGFESLINTFQEAQNKLIGTKDSMGELIDQYRAFQMTISSMSANNSGMNQAIGTDAYEALLKTQPLLAGISNEADTMAGILAKWQLFTSNVNINLRQIDSGLALKIASFTSAIDSGISAMAKSGGDSNTFGTVGSALLKLDAIAKSVSRNAQRNAAAAQKNLQEELKLIQKKIKLIEEEKNKKLEALNATQDKENYQLELQKLQIEYQDAIANGDMARAAQAQISMQQLTKDRQADLARKAIEDAAAAKIKPLEADAERKNKKGEDIQNRMAASQDRAADASEAAGKISGFSGRYNELVKTQISNELIADQSERNAAMAATQEQILALIKEIQTAGTGKGYEAEQIRSAFSKYFDKSGKAVPMTTTTSGYVGSRFQTTTSPSNVGAGIIANDIAAAKAQATAITGGTTIEKLRSDLLVALGKNPGVAPSGNNSTGVVVKDAGKRGTVPVSGTTENQKTGQREKITAGLTEISASRIVNGGRLKVGDLLIVGPNGSIRPAISLSDGTIKKSGQMKVENIFSNSEGQRVQLSVYRAQGGRVVPGVPYALNDGGKIEGIKFDMPGTVYPNAMTMPKYNVGGPIEYGKLAYGNPPPSSNALYNINVTLNGTDLSAEDVAQAIHNRMRIREISSGVGRRV